MAHNSLQRFGSIGAFTKQIKAPSVPFDVNWFNVMIPWNIMQARKQSSCHLRSCSTRPLWTIDHDCIDLQFVVESLIKKDRSLTISITTIVLWSLGSITDKQSGRFGNMSSAPHKQLLLFRTETAKHFLHQLNGRTCGLIAPKQTCSTWHIFQKLNLVHLKCKTLELVYFFSPCLTGTICCIKKLFAPPLRKIVLGQFFVAKFCLLCLLEWSIVAKFCPRSITVPKP